MAKKTKTKTAPKPKPTKLDPDNPLVGRGVHFWKDGEPIYQGTILATMYDPPGCLVLIQLLDWHDDTEIYQRIVPLAQLASDANVLQNGWTLYDNDTHRDIFHEQFQQNRHEPKATDTA